MSSKRMHKAYASTHMGQIHYASIGQGPPLIMLCQSSRSSAMFTNLATDLADDFSCFAIDYPGSGASDPLPEDATLEDIALCMVDFLDDNGIDKTHVYGIHTGNKIGAALAAYSPQRIHKAVLAGQSHSLVADNERRLHTVGKTRRKLLSATDERESTLVHWADIFNEINKYWWDEHLVRNLTNTHLRNWTQQRVADEILSANSMPDLYRANYAFDLKTAFSRITVPTLIVEIQTPSEDHYIGRQGPTLLELIPGSKLHTIDEKDFFGITLEHRHQDVAVILRQFLNE